MYLKLLKLYQNSYEEDTKSFQKFKKLHQEGEGVIEITFILHIGENIKIYKPTTRPHHIGLLLLELCTDKLKQVLQVLGFSYILVFASSHLSTILD